MVHIKKVDIFGFKSFGFKNTTVLFEPGLVSISGPNGSGKSNILDAIIFAFGENRPKTMRADKLRSLIHDIEGGRHGPKISRVSVQLDNSDRKLPVDSDTVVITREMDDKGENIYFLDKKKTTRTHILDILEIANAGLNQLNAVQQGTVTRISEFSPEEKREAIENLIGLSYFDEKKSEALKQLDDADRRLEVALAKMGEIKKRIDELEEERNLQLRNDLLTKEINRFNAIESANKLKTIKTEKLSKERNLNAISAEIKKLDSERAEIRKEIHELTIKKRKFMEEVNAYTKAKAEIDSELSGAIHKSEQEKGEINTAKKRLEKIETRLPEIKTTVEQIQESRGALESNITALREDIRNINDEKRITNDEIKRLDSELNKVLREQSKLSSQKLEVDNKIKKLTTKLNDAKLSLTKLENASFEISSKINVNSNRHGELIEEQEKLSNLKQRLESIISNHKATIDELKSRISKLVSQKNKIQNDIEGVNFILEKATTSTAKYETKIQVIKGIMHEDYSIAQLKSDAKTLGIEGSVYEILSWDKKYERPILAVSSDIIKALVVKDFATLFNLADFVKTKKLPKLKMIPLDVIPSFEFELPKNDSVIGVLADFVTCDNRYSKLKKFLFGNIVLVKSRDAAYNMSKSGYKAVTIDGEFFEAKNSSVVVDVDSKISKVTKIISMSTSVEGLNKSINLLKNYIVNKKRSLKKIENNLQSYKARLSVSETGLATTNNNYSDLKTKITSANKTASFFSTRISQLQRKMRRITTEIAKQNSYVDSLEQRIAIVQDNYSDPSQKRVAEELTRLNEKKSALNTKQSDVITQLREKESELATLLAAENKEKSNSKTLHEEQAALNHEKHELETKLKELEKDYTINEEKLVELRNKEQELIATSGKSVDQVKEFDDKLQELRDQEHSLSTDINSRERQTDSLSRDLKDLTENEDQLQKLLSHYGFSETLETFDVAPLLKALSAEQRSLSELVNRKAAEQYVELSTGYRSMSTRKNELEEERNSIVKFIESIEKDKRQTFLDAFDRVDKEIREIFTKMTGGNAWLELQNEDDIFNSGISYLIQFPNKPKRESTSISGGEKTLAAVVFVLALQKLKPSPFYLFDEIDAHLDAPNSERLAKIIEERSKGSQFLMVSLKDSVVQRAKLIYGVYPKNGVSHIVTYKDKRLSSMAS